METGELSGIQCTQINQQTMYSKIPNQFDLVCARSQLQNQHQFILKVKEQKQKVQLLGIQFQQQQQLLATQTLTIKQLQTQNTNLRAQTYQFYEKQQTYIHAISAKDSEIQQLTHRVNVLSSECTRFQIQEEEREQQERMETLRSLEAKQFQPKLANMFKQQLRIVTEELKSISNRFNTKCQEIQQLHSCLELASVTITKLQAETLNKQRSLEWNKREHEDACKRYQMQILELKDAGEKYKEILNGQQKSTMVSESEGCYLKLKVERLEDELRERERVIEKLEGNIVGYHQSMKMLEEDVVERESVIEQLHGKLQEQQRVHRIKKELYFEREKETTQLDQLISTLKIKHNR